MEAGKVGVRKALSDYVRQRVGRKLKSYDKDQLPWTLATLAFWTYKQLKFTPAQQLQSSLDFRYAAKMAAEETGLLDATEAVVRKVAAGMELAFAEHALGAIVQDFIQQQGAAGVQAGHANASAQPQRRVEVVANPGAPSAPLATSLPQGDGPSFTGAPAPASALTIAQAPSEHAGRKLKKEPPALLPVGPVLSQPKNEEPEALVAGPSGADPESDAGPARKKRRSGFRTGGSRKLEQAGLHYPHANQEIEKQWPDSTFLRQATPAVANQTLPQVQVQHSSSINLLQEPVQPTPSSQPPPAQPIATFALSPQVQQQAVQPLQQGVAHVLTAPQPCVPLCVSELRPLVSKWLAKPALEARLRKHCLKLNNKTLRRYSLPEQLGWSLLDLLAYAVVLAKMGVAVDFMQAASYVAEVLHGRQPGTLAPGIMEKVSQAMSKAYGKYKLAGLVEAIAKAKALKAPKGSKKQKSRSSSRINAATRHGISADDVAHAAPIHPLTTADPLPVPPESTQAASAVATALPVGGAAHGAAAASHSLARNCGLLSQNLSNVHTSPLAGSVVHALPASQATIQQQGGQPVSHARRARQQRSTTAPPQPTHVSNPTSTTACACAFGAGSEPGPSSRPGTNPAAAVPPQLLAAAPASSLRTVPLSSAAAVGPTGGTGGAAATTTTTGAPAGASSRKVRGAAAAPAVGHVAAPHVLAELEPGLRVHLARHGSSRIGTHCAGDGLGWSLLELAALEVEQLTTAAARQPHQQPVQVDFQAAAKAVATRKYGCGPPGSATSPAPGVLDKVAKAMREAHNRYALHEFVTLHIGTSS